MPINLSTFLKAVKQNIARIHNYHLGSDGSDG